MMKSSADVELDQTIRDAVARDYGLGRAEQLLCTDTLEPAHGGPLYCMRPEGHDGLHNDGSGPWAR